MRYRVCQFPDKTNNFVFLGPNLPKNGFWGRNFKNLSLRSESAPPRHHVSQFLVKMDNFQFFAQNLGKLSNYVWYFGSNIVEGVLESWVEAEMSWVEVDRAGWRWVHGLLILFHWSKFFWKVRIRLISTNSKDLKVPFSIIYPVILSCFINSKIHDSSIFYIITSF